MADEIEDYIVDLQSIVISAETYNKYFGDKEWDSDQFLIDHKDSILVEDVVEGFS